MFNSGLKPTRYDHRDYDFHKSFGFGAAPAQFPDEYSVENGLWCPNQNIGGEVFNLPPMPWGCTNYTQSDCCADDDQKLYNPLDLENITHANARQGIAIRESLDAAKKAFGRTAYFNVRAIWPLDFFDAIRLAMWSTKDEGRSVSAGTLFYPEWSSPSHTGVLTVPSDFKDKRATWHNWKIAGWKTIGGAPYLICKMWAGPTYGDKGFVYMSRELANAVFNISGTAAFTMTKVAPSEIQTVDFNLVAFIVSFIRKVFNLDAPMPAPAPEPAPQPVPEPPKLLWDTKEHVRKSIRIMCDEAGLTFEAKNILTACIYQESRFNPKAIGRPNSNGTRDWGLCQYNDGHNPKTGAPYWIGPGAAFKDTTEVLNDPEKNVRIMIQMMKAQKINLWASYKTDAYKQWLTLVQNPIV